MTIKNPAPRKMVLFSPTVGYNSAYIPHSAYSDEDVRGKSFVVYSGGAEVARQFDTVIDKNYHIVPSLTPDQLYEVEGAYIDQMVNTTFLNANIGMIFSDRLSIKTRKEPIIKTVTVTATEVDVGVGMPYVNFDIEGEADFVTLEAKQHGSTDDNYRSIFIGAPNNNISIPLTPNTYDFRVKGSIALPDGLTVDTSGYSIKENIKVDYVFTPPAKPTNLNFGVVRIRDGKERFDLKVGWDWVKGATASVREFVLYYVSKTEYDKTKWAKASVINTGASTATSIIGFPFGDKHVFKVSAISWGPTGGNTTESDLAEFEINDQTSVDFAVDIDTGIEVNYAHIRAYNIAQDGTKTQTFNIDAATGALAIGMLDGQGQAPITVDPVGKVVNIDGRIISKEMYTASLVLSNLTGKDNPAIRTSSKTGYGQAAQGLWMGYDNTDTKFKFDVGDATQYIRWDGNKLVISSQVQIGTPAGDVGLLEGTRSPGIYSQPLVGFTAFNETKANEFFMTNFGVAATKFDVLTQYETGNPNNAVSKQWDGTAWIAPSLFIHGNAIVDGSLTADKLVADSAFLTKMGVNVIYDNPAMLTPDPEANFKMKIDLEHGSIFIR